MITRRTLFMNETTEKLERALHKMVGTGMLAAVVVVVYLLTMGLYIGPFNITFALVPIVVGAALYGWQSGLGLGFVFGAMVLVTGGANAFIPVNAPGAIITCIAKGALAGLAAGVIYNALKRKSRWAAAICAAAAAPIVNTGVLLLGCAVFFMDTINEWAAGAGVESAGVYMVTVFVGLNFLVELGVNLLLSSVIVRIIDIAKNSVSKGLHEQGGDDK